MLPFAALGAAAFVCQLIAALQFLQFLFEVHVTRL
jgi:hypothetical protein